MQGAWGEIILVEREKGREKEREEEREKERERESGIGMIYNRKNRIARKEG